MGKHTVLVTGAASGIGLACVRILMESGANVVAFDIQGERMAEELSANDDLALYTGDVSDPVACADVVTEALERFAVLDALIHWGAAHSSARWDELDVEECNQVMAVNVTGSFLIAQAAARPMVERGKGAIVLSGGRNCLENGSLRIARPNMFAPLTPFAAAVTDIFLWLNADGMAGFNPARPGTFNASAGVKHSISSEHNRLW